MDSVTHLFYGAAICAAIAPARHRRAALLAGAALNTLPDLDVFPLLLLDDPILRMTWHRGPTHSLLVLPLIGLAIWALLRRHGGRVSESPRRWFWAIQITLLAHPLLDAFTVYGTQLLWPLATPPAMWSTLFIIDPLFTLPWLAAALLAYVAHQRRWSQTALLAGIAMGTAYLGWSLVAKQMVEQRLQRALAAQGIGDAARFSVPMPFNTLLWRVVALTPTGFVEGETSLVADSSVPSLRHLESERVALDALSHTDRIGRLLWFNHHFVKSEIRDDGLVVSDLRMGSEPDYVFRFLVARQVNGEWRALLPTRELPSRMPTSRGMGELWQRIWQSPPQTDDQAATGTSGDTPAISASK